MGDSLKNAKLKAQRLAREQIKRERKENLDYVTSLSGVNALKFDISNLESTIRCCDYDLRTLLLKNSQIILNKKLNAESQLIEKTKKLKELMEIKNE